jgi:hypothetical protein
MAIQDQVKYFGACPHRPIVCMAGFPCPYFYDQDCHVADNFDRTSYKPEYNISTNNAPWTISAAITRGMKEGK